MDFRIKFFEIKKMLNKKIIISYFLLNIILSIVLNKLYPFPHYNIFFALFVIIFLTTSFAINKFFTELDSILNGLGVEHEFIVLYHKHKTNIYFYIIIPILTIVIFGFVAISIFEKFKFSLTFLLLLLNFVLCVWTSMIAYIQYLFLLNILKCLNSYDNYTSLQISENSIPAQNKWIVKLTKLFHIYSIGFFISGTLYIIGYGLFNFSNEMNVNTQSCLNYILWIIIFVAIIMGFPIFFIYGYNKIKTIVELLKDKYINIYIFDFNNSNNDNFNIVNNSMLKIFYVDLIQKSQDYPLKLGITTTIGTISTILNIFITIYSLP